MGSEAAGTAPARTRRLDATSAVDVERLLDEAAAVDGFRGLSDQLAADLADLLSGGRRAADDCVTLGLESGRGGLAGIAVASRRGGGWTAQAVIGPRHRGGGGELHRLLADLLAAIAGRGGGRVDWWTYDPGEVEQEVAAELDFVVDRELLQMRRRLPTERRPEVTTRAFVPGQDDDAWLTVNNRAFAGHHEQSNWTVETLQQRMRQPWFDAEDLRLYERDGRLAAFCWTKRHDETTGEIYVIGVDPDFQGLGLGSQLTLAGLDHLARRGVTTALLYVAAENETAVTMYSRLGFTVHRVDRAYVGEVVAAAQ